jgi:hypothetical protein
VQHQYPKNIPCFRYVRVNIPRKGDKNDDDDGNDNGGGGGGDDDNNNNNNNPSPRLPQPPQPPPQTTKSSSTREEKTRPGGLFQQNSMTCTPDLFIATDDNITALTECFQPTTWQSQVYLGEERSHIGPSRHHKH